MANPHAPREPDRLINRLRHHPNFDNAELKDLQDEAIGQAERYKNLRRGAATEHVWRARLDAQWDAVLVAVDAYLEAEDRFFQASGED